MKKFGISLLLALSLAQAASFAPSRVCKTCHPAIYNEYMTSMHRKSSVVNDPVHQAVWNKHPLKAKQRYTCAACHSPTDTALTKALKESAPALPDADNPVQQDEPIGCATCHRIRDIKTHPARNINIYNDTPKHYYAAKNGKTVASQVKFHEERSVFGLNSKTTGSPFHTIDYTNPRFTDGTVCLGCHDHKRNKHGLAICNIDRNTTAPSGKETCITCHMPQVKGSLSTITQTPTHAFHGFAGLHVRPRLLAKHLGLKADTDGGKLRISVENKADHRLFTHPLRLGELRVTVERDGMHITLPPVHFYTVLGRDGKPAMPWIADRVLKHNGIGAKETRTFTFDAVPQKGDRVTVTLGYHIVNPKTAKKLGITDPALQKFTVLKSETFSF